MTCPTIFLSFRPKQYRTPRVIPSAAPVFATTKTGTQPRDLAIECNSFCNLNYHSSIIHNHSPWVAASSSKGLGMVTFNDILSASSL